MFDRRLATRPGAVIPPSLMGHGTTHRILNVSAMGTSIIALDDCPGTSSSLPFDGSYTVSDAELDLFDATVTYVYQQRAR